MNTAALFDKPSNGELGLRRIVVGKIPTITLNPGTIKCLSNIPSGYFMVVDTPGQVPYRPGGTPQCLDYSMAEVGVKLNF